MFYSFIKILYVSMYFDKEYRFFRLPIKCPQQMSIQFAIEKKTKYFAHRVLLFEANVSPTSLLLCWTQS